MSKKIIAHVDDDPNLTEAVAMILSQMDFEVVSFNSMEAFFEKVDNGLEPNLVIFDVMVEHADSGLKGYDWFKVDNRKVPVILLTSLGPSEVKPYFEAQGEEVTVIEKPVDPAHLQHLVKSKLS